MMSGRLLPESVGDETWIFETREFRTDNEDHNRNERRLSNSNSLQPGVQKNHDPTLRDADDDEIPDDNWEESDSSVTESETDDSVFRVAVSSNVRIPPPPSCPPPLPPLDDVTEEKHSSEQRLKDWLHSINRSGHKNRSFQPFKCVRPEEGDIASDGSVFESVRSSLRSSCSSTSSKKRVSFMGLTEAGEGEAVNGNEVAYKPQKLTSSSSGPRLVLESGNKRSILKTPSTSVVEEEEEDEEGNNIDINGAKRIKVNQNEQLVNLQGRLDSICLDSYTNLSTPALSDHSAIRKIFVQTVRHQSIYEALKQSQKCSWKNAMRKGAGIPFALIYYFVVVWIVSSFILENSGHSHENAFLNFTDAAKNICDTVIFSKGDHSNSTFPLYSRNEYHVKPDSTSTNKRPQDTDTNESQPHTKSNDILFVNDYPELHIITGSFMGVIGITSVFSRNTRATMLLILPGLITNRSRHVIYTIILGMLINGPVANIRENFNKLMDNSICLYASVVAFGCVKQKEGSLVLSYAKNIFQSFVKLLQITKNMHCSFTGKSSCSNTAPDPFPYSDNIIDDIRTLSAPSTRGIKAQGTVLVHKAKALRRYFELARKAFTLVSIFLLIVDAVLYLHSYYADSSFDNKHICQTTRLYWKRKDYYADSDVLKKHPFALWDDKKGLRRWEVSEGYTTTFVPRFSLRLLRKVARNCISLFCFIIFVSLVLVTDHLLAATLQHIRNDDKFHINLSGFQHNITSNIRAEMPKLNTKTCLAVPHVTPNHVIVSISLLLMLAVFSCVLQVLFSGIRAKLCAVFYPDRVEERADYLYFRIVTGRINRKGNLLMLVRREVEKREKLLRFSPVQRFSKFFYSLTGMKRVKVLCPGCNRRVKELKMKDLSLEMVGKREGTRICTDCEIDLASKYRSSAC